MGITLNNTLKLPYTYRQEFWDWCEDQGFEPQYVGTGVYAVDVWTIKDEQMYMLALLRWSHVNRI